MKIILLSFVVIIILASVNAGCVDREDSDGASSGFDSWFQKAKCDISATADRVAEKTKLAFEKTKEVAVEGYEKARDLVGDGVEKAKEVSKSTSTYISEAFSDDHKSSEEQDTDNKPAVTDFDVIGANEEVQKSV